MIPPPIHRGMKILQRELFRIKVELVGVRIAANSTAKFLKVLKDDLFHQPKMKNVANDPESKDTRIILLKSEVQSLEQTNKQNSKLKEFIELKSSINQFGFSRYTVFQKPISQEAISFHVINPTIEQIDDANISQESRDLISHEALGFVKHTVELDYGNWGADDILKAILPEDSEVPSSFTQIGHIAHMNLRDEFLPWKKIIGQVILDKNPKIKTVVNKTDIIDTTFRFFSMEILAGIDNMIAEVKEGNCRFRLDFSQVYWNSRLHSEHERLVNLFKKGDHICDVFAGIGPFAVPAAKKGCIVYANDLNPISYKYLQENGVLNKVQSRIFSYNMDGRDFIRKIVKDLHATLAIAATTTTSAAISKSITGSTFKTQRFQMFDHFVMNLPATAIEFLDAFKGLYHEMESVIDSPLTELPMIHCHCFSKIHFVRSVAPNKDMYCVSFRLNASVAFGAVPSKPEISVSLGLTEQADNDHEEARERKKRKVEVNSADDDHNNGTNEIEEKY
ncbi:5621_t:CDS:10 [Ambispora gerdemannii]|uniref:tRNA (guanine(37)-N1)-methyltransferase n=1 Tax=Ambispora gerdemannii TaxID=144530 RepID=A0A9N9A693_9GLOM|nr:5621_t:CDS:10 [Ambispora gerdemannii]